MNLPRVKKDRAYYLRVFRAKHDLTVAQAAALIGLKGSAWSLIESGKRNASPQVAAKLAALVPLPIEQFLGIKVTRVYTPTEER